MATRLLLVLSLALAAPLGAQTRGAAPASTGPVWQIVPQPQSSLVYARDGSLIGEIGRESRTVVSIRTLPKYVGQAFVAVEDQRFYQHDGVPAQVSRASDSLRSGARATTVRARER